MIQHPDGLFFGLSNAEYQDDDALGYSAHKQLLINAVRYQNKHPRLAQLRADLGMPDNPDREETIDQAFGSMVDMLVLEPHLFADTYTTSEEPPPHVLQTKEQMAEQLTPLGVVFRRDAKLIEYELACRTRGIGPLLADWKAERAELNAGKIVVSDRWMAMARLIERQLDAPRPSYAGKSIRERILSDGYPQVSVFWTDERGVRLKARFDYLRIKAIIDAKSFGARDDQEIVDAFVGAASRWAYDVQAAHYRDARAQIPDLVSRGAVFGEVDPAWLARLVAYTERPAWTWLTIQKFDWPEVDEMEHQGEIVDGAAWQMVLQARATFVEYRDRFGLDQPWVADRGRIILRDETFRQSMTSRGAIRWETA